MHAGSPEARGWWQRPVRRSAVPARPSSSVCSATGLSFLRNDAILLPVIVIALGFALWGFWRRRRVHAATGPFALGVVGAVVLLTGVVVLHGIVAKLFIAGGTVFLFAATIWNARLPVACDVTDR
jgi:MerC mercury resistance protein